MSSTRCAYLLAAILVLLPVALAQTGGALDSGFDTAQSLPTLGGQLSAGRDLTFTNSVDKYPRTVSTAAVSGGFTVATALPVGGSVTFYFPKGYFASTDVSKKNAFSGTSTTFTCASLIKGTATDAWDRFTCVIAGAELSVGAQTFSFAAGFITTGEPSAAANYKVETSVDNSMIVHPQTAAIGGIVTSASMTGSLSTNNPNAAAVTFAFTTATPLPIGGAITLNMPSKYIASVSSSAVNTIANTKVTATCTLTVASGTATTDSIVCTTAGDTLAPTSQTFNFVIGALTGGVPTATSSKFTVATSTDRVSAEQAVQKIGDQVTVGDFTALDVAERPGAVNSAPVKFSLTDVTAVPIGGLITIALPPKYFSAVDSSKANQWGDVKASCSYTAGVSGIKVLGFDGYDTVLCTTSTSASAKAAKDFTFVAGAVTLGTPQDASVFAVATSTDLASDGTKKTAELGKAVTSTSAFVFAAADAVPFVTNSAAATTGIKFTTATALPVGGKFTISLPKGYFSAVDSNKVAAVNSDTTATCILAPGTAYGVAAPLKGGDQVICTTAGKEVAAASAVEFKFAVGQITMGKATLEVADGLQIETSMDRRVANLKAPQIGGLLTAGNVLTLDVADTEPFQLNTKAVIVGFTPVTPLAVGKQITITGPKGYFSKLDESKVNKFTTGTTSATATCALVQATGISDTDEIICSTSGAILTATAQELTLAVGTITTGSATSAYTKGWNIQTTVDNKLALGVDTLALGKTVNAVTDFIFTNAADTIPGKYSTNNDTVTFTMKPSSDIPINGKITVSLPSNYFSKVDSTRDVSIGTAATAKCTLTKQSVVQVSSSITLSDSTPSKSDVTMTISVVPSVVSGVTSIVLPVAPGFSGDVTSVATCTANCAVGDPGKVSAQLKNDLLTISFPSDNSILKRNVLTTFTITKVKNPSTAGWATSSITASLINALPSQVVCTTAGAAVLKDSIHTVTFPAGSISIGTGQKASTFTIETSSDLPLNTGKTVALGGGMSGYKTLAFSNPLDAIPGRRNSGTVTFGITLANSVPAGGQVILSLTSNYFTDVDPKAQVTMTKASARRSLLQTVTLSCVRTPGTTTDTITCTTNAVSGTGAQTFTFPAGSVTTGLPASTPTININTANPPVVTARVPYFPKAPAAAHGVAALLLALCALLCLI